jgi:hypothetical protein
LVAAGVSRRARPRADVAMAAPVDVVVFRAAVAVAVVSVADVSVCAAEVEVVVCAESERASRNIAGIKDVAREKSLKSHLLLRVAAKQSARPWGYLHQICMQDNDL